MKNISGKDTLNPDTEEYGNEYVVLFLLAKSQIQRDHHLILCDCFQ
jgi:hypothetical protein